MPLRKRTIKYSSHKNGVYNPGALMIEFDILRFGESTPQGRNSPDHLGCWLKRNAAGFARIFLAKIKIFLGMKDGLPLAGKVTAPKLVLDGVINQVFGNWQGIELRLDFIIVVGPVQNVPNNKPVPLPLTL